MRFGIATCDITPTFPTLMHGYGARTDLYDGVNDPLTFTAVVIEEGSRRMMMGAADICTFHWDRSIRPFLERIGKVVGCPPDNVMLNASHTHGGAMISVKMPFFRMLDDGGATQRYGELLTEKVLEATRAACENTIEGTLWYGEGSTDLPMNRRLTVNGEVLNAPNPDGSTDNRLQLLVFKNKAGEIAAVGAKISCHPVTTGAQHLLTADFPGAWRGAVRKALGERVTPFFLQGAGADARPRHAQDGDVWKAKPHSMLPEIGWGLCAETLKVLTGKPLTPVTDLILQGKINVVSAPCEKRNTERAHFEPFIRDGGKYKVIYGKEGIRKLEMDEAIPDQIDFLVQTVWLNREFALIGMDAEPLHALGYTVEKAVAPRETMLLGYTNGCVGYTPDTAEMKRGGYETTSYIHSIWTGPLLPGLEHLFAEAVVAEPPAE